MSSVMEHRYSDCLTHESWPTLGVGSRCVSAKGRRGRTNADNCRGLAHRSLHCARNATENLKSGDVAVASFQPCLGDATSWSSSASTSSCLSSCTSCSEQRTSESNSPGGQGQSQESVEDGAQAENMTKPKRTVVLSLDYDNCMDVLFEGVDLRLRRRNMTKELEIMTRVRNALEQDLQRITAGADRVILMVGSNRQSIHVDQFNRERLEREIGPVCSEVGWVRHDFQKLAEEKGWELNRALLADKENNVPAGTAWNNDELRIRFERGMDKSIKQNLIQYQFEQLRDVEGHIDFYFFDDHSEYLDFVRRQVAVPPSTHFFTVHFDWFSHIVEQKPMDLHAIDTEDRPQSFEARRS